MPAFNDVGDGALFLAASGTPCCVFPEGLVDVFGDGRGSDRAGPHAVLGTSCQCS